MTSYVDVDSSAEGLQEDEELIEAVEQIVEKAAQTVYKDIKTEVHGAYATFAPTTRSTPSFFFKSTAQPYVGVWLEICCCCSFALIPVTKSVAELYF